MTVMADEGWAKHVADILRRNDIRLFATVPDIVSHVLEHQWADSECRVVTVTREEEGVGLLSGAWLAGKAGCAAHAEQRARQLRQRARFAVPGEPDPDRARDQPSRQPRRVQSRASSEGRAEGRFGRDVVGYARRFKQALADLPAR